MMTKLYVSDEITLFDGIEDTVKKGEIKRVKGQKQTKKYKEKQVWGIDRPETSRTSYKKTKKRNKDVEDRI
jgi:hypothetical protein